MKKIGEVVTTIPTIGFNVESVTYKNLNFNVWDLGGQTSIRPYWRCYYSNTAAVIFVIDSTDIDRLNTASNELAAMLNEEELRDAALLVFANKQDQPGAKGAGEISEALKLGELKDRNWSIMACSAIDGRGVSEGMDWLVVRLLLGDRERTPGANIVLLANCGREHLVCLLWVSMCSAWRSGVVRYIYGELLHTPEKYRYHGQNSALLRLPRIFMATQCSLAEAR